MGDGYIQNLFYASLKLRTAANYDIKYRMRRESGVEK